MKGVIGWIINYWWVVPFFMVLQMLVILFVMIQIPGGWAEDVAFVMWLVAAIIELVLLGLLLYHKEWKRFFFSIVVIMGIVVVLPFVSLIAMSAPDGFARHHPIPEGMELNIPLGDGEATIDSNNVDSFLQIWNGDQGGIYEYDFYYPQLSAGTIFLRCFEAGKNEPLSEDRLLRSSSVGNTAVMGFSKVVEKQQFTIYEGDWGEYYAVRVEVWHRDSISCEETKLMEKIYRMEGWMR